MEKIKTDRVVLKEKWPVQIDKPHFRVDDARKKIGNGTEALILWLTVPVPLNFRLNDKADNSLEKAETSRIVLTEDLHPSTA